MMSEYWIPNTPVYNELQQLKTFVNFAAALPSATKKDKDAAREIISKIENIDKPDSFKSWNVCIDIFDRNIQDGINKQGGIYWRQWAVWFEKDYLEIVAKTTHTDDAIYHYGDDFEYSSMIYFKKELPGRRIYIDKPLHSFIADALKYQSYITQTLNDIEVDIDID